MACEGRSFSRSEQKQKKKMKKKNVTNMQNWLICLFQACFVLLTVELNVFSLFYFIFFVVSHNEAVGIVIRNS